MVSIDSDVVDEGYDEVRKYKDKEKDHKWYQGDRPRLSILDDVSDVLWYHSDRDWSEYVDKEADEDLVTKITDRIMEENEGKYQSGEDE